MKRNPSKSSYNKTNAISIIKDSTVKKDASRIVKAASCVKIQPIPDQIRNYNQNISSVKQSNAGKSTINLQSNANQRQKNETINKIGDTICSTSIAQSRNKKKSSCETIKINNEQVNLTTILKKNEELEQ
jgi:hypothetical protein